MNLNSLPFNWFDLLVVITLCVGILRGRKRGMSEELMPLLKWLLVILGAAFVYQPIGQMIFNNSSVFTLLSCYLIAYVGSVMVIAGLFALTTKLMGGKLVGSDVFGTNEYYLGMVAGMLRFTCILIGFLALLNARLYQTHEIRAAEKFQKDVYGSNFFPTLQSIQAQVFQKSFFGPLIKDNLAFVLIKPTEPEKKEMKKKQFELP